MALHDLADRFAHSQCPQPICSDLAVVPGKAQSRTERPQPGEGCAGGRRYPVQDHVGYPCPEADASAGQRDFANVVQ